MNSKALNLLSNSQSKHTMMIANLPHRFNDQLLKEEFTVVTRGLRDCFDLNFYILYFVYNFVLQKLCYKYGEERRDST